MLSATVDSARWLSMAGESRVNEKKKVESCRVGRGTSSSEQIDKTTDVDVEMPNLIPFNWMSFTKGCQTFHSQEDFFNISKSFFPPFPLRSNASFKVTYEIPSASSLD